MRRIRPLDMIGFVGDSSVSKIIRRLEKRAVGKIDYDFSHVGIIVTSEILPVVSLDDGKQFHLVPKELYLLESTVSSGPEDVCDPEHRVGVQLRKLNEILLSHPGVDTYHCRLKENPLDTEDRDVVRTKFSIFFHTYWKQRYTIDPVSAMGLIFPSFRKPRKISRKILKRLGISDMQLCSELVARCYQRIGILSMEYNASDVTPTDFCDTDLDGTPRLFRTPVQLV